MDFSWRIVAGLRRRIPGVDIIAAQELGLHHTPDPEVLREAQARDRILLTHDVGTMPGHFNNFLAGLPAGEHSPGVMLVRQGLRIGVAIHELALVWSCSTHDEWRDQLTHIPL